MAIFISHSPAQTSALGEQWGREAGRGWVFGLSGLARGLGVAARVQSPTFALVNEYRDGRLPLFHVDLYRLATPRDIIAAGLELYLDKPDGVAVVEWIERWLQDGARPCARGVRFRRVEIKTASETGREIIYEDFGD